MLQSSIMAPRALPRPPIQRKASLWTGTQLCCRLDYSLNRMSHPRFLLHQLCVQSCPKGFFPCWWCCFSWAFPSSSSRSCTLKSQVQVVIKLVSISETGFLVCYMHISLIFGRRVCGWLNTLWRLEKNGSRSFLLKAFSKEIKKTFQNWHSINVTYKWSNDLYVSYRNKNCLLLRIGDIVKNTRPFRIICL